MPVLLRTGASYVVGGHGPKGGLKRRPSKKVKTKRGLKSAQNAPIEKHPPKFPTGPSYNFSSSGTPVGTTFLLLPPGSEQPLVSYIFSNYSLLRSFEFYSTGRKARPFAAYPYNNFRGNNFLNLKYTTRHSQFQPVL
jgi:hypothetical protein